MKYAFIICTNSEQYYNECLLYLDRLVVPEDSSVEVIAVTEAKSMTAGYNEGMAATDADIKIYMHQDVFILYPYFLQAITDIFASDSTIGMIGMVGAKEMSSDGVMWHNREFGNLYNEEVPDIMYSNLVGYRYNAEKDGYIAVQVIDGLLMATPRDISWREDIFDGWDFYDASQSMEMKRQGNKVVVPIQQSPWCLHEDGAVLNLRNYDKYRRLFLQEYGRDI